MLMSAKFDGKIVLVGGGTGGLGRAVTLAFLKDNSRVIITYRVQKEFDGLKSAAGKNETNLERHVVDVTDEAAGRQLVEKIVGKYRRLDLLVNTVGGYDVGTRVWALETRRVDPTL